MRSEVAVAEQDVPADLGAHVLQRHQVGEDWKPPDHSVVDAGVDHHDLFADHPDGDVDAVGLEERPGPHPGGDDDGARRDFGAVGEPHTGDPVTVDEQTGDGGSLLNPHPCRAGGRRKRLCGQVRVAVAAAGFPSERRERRQVGERPHPCHLGVVDLLGLHPDSALRGKAFAQRVHVGFADADDIAGLTEPDVECLIPEKLEAARKPRGRRRPLRPAS